MLKKLPLYPFLFAVYPVVTLGTYNIFEIVVGDMWRALVVSLALAAMVLGLARLLFRDWHLAALATTLALLLFFSYGQVYDVLKGIEPGGVSLFRHRTLAPLWLALFGIGAYWLGRRPRFSTSATPLLNALTALLLVYPAVAIASAIVPRVAAEYGTKRAMAQMMSPAQRARDIYFIILDAYARQDALESETGYDNTEFILALEARGFYVADCSQSNYGHTRLSLASSLNLDYLDNLGASRAKDLDVILKDSKARVFLESKGYKTVAFPTGYKWSEWDDADTYLQPQYGGAGSTELENVILGTTLLRIPLDFGLLDSVVENSNDRYRQRIRFTLEHLKEIPADRAPTFTFAHLLIPHFPYAFGPNGEPVEYYWGQPRASNVRGYRDQVIFINGEILEVVDAILRESEHPPIIIIQGDHGAPFEFGSDAQHMMNLSAYYLPGVQVKLYPSITPVNNFRLIFDAYFGENLPLLDDRSYFATDKDKFDLIYMPPSCPGD